MHIYKLPVIVVTKTIITIYVNLHKTEQRDDGANRLNVEFMKGIMLIEK
jgi:hypothetical protein